ncbi:MAG TPA: hypothetical protein PKD61_05060, partial [Polyangiaceae bacterium]|nr:hypothetical protein [Polyangiaceae bacterium]
MGKSFLRSLVSGGVVCLFAVAVASACGSSSAEERAALAGLAADCNINSDCKSPLKCAFRRCHTECETQVDCDANELCVVSDRPYKVCLLPIERGCSSNNDCPEPLFCSVEKDSTCRPACITSKDCITGQVCADGFCAAPPELVDGGLPAPTDGGVDASLGNKCLYNSDCGGNLLCISGLCLPQCKTAKDCPASHTCEQGACIPPGVADGGSDGGSDTGVTVPPCQNGVQDGDETGVDCGGSCGACVGTPCTKPSECASAQCVAKQCAAPNCTDGLQNGTESDVDCGGDCPKCPPQKGCWATQDCTTGSCVAGSCTAPGCSDTLLNGAETDVDCGGAECNPCADGKKCEGNSDCTSANCVGKKCVKAGPTSWVLNTTSEGYSGEVTSDAQNNVVAALNYFYAIDVGNGSVSANNYDVMLAKLTPAG